MGIKRSIADYPLPVTIYQPLNSEAVLRLFEKKNPKMDLWKGKVAVVTGASSGIGAEICKSLCKSGVIVAGLSRRRERLEALKEQILEVNQAAQFYAVQCDVTVEEEVQTAFDYVKSKLGGVDILVNNAGVVVLTTILGDEDNLEKLKTVLDTNFTAVVSCTKKAFKSMLERDVPGYIINISSVTGHSVDIAPGTKPLANVYHSSKYAITALGKVIRNELNFAKNRKVRISNISPGAVRTEILAGSGFDIGSLKHLLEPSDISDVVMHLLSLHPRIQVEDVIIRPKERE